MINIKWRPTHRNIKRGTLYMRLFEGKTADDFDSKVPELTPLVTYMAQNHSVWHRRPEVFAEKFETLPEGERQTGITTLQLLASPHDCTMYIVPTIHSIGYVSRLKKFLKRDDIKVHRAPETDGDMDWLHNRSQMYRQYFVVDHDVELSPRWWECLMYHNEIIKSSYGDLWPRVLDGTLSVDPVNRRIDDATT